MHLLLANIIFMHWRRILCRYRTVVSWFLISFVMEGKARTGRTSSFMHLLLYPPQYGPCICNLAPAWALVHKTTYMHLRFIQPCAYCLGCIHNHYLGKWEGVRPWNSRVFWAPNDTCLSARCHFTGPKKLLNSRAQPPPTCPCYGYAVIHASKTWCTGLYKS
jgi:hypothetical protein